MAMPKAPSALFHISFIIPSREIPWLLDQVADRGVRGLQLQPVPTKEAQRAGMLPAGDLPKGNRMVRGNVAAACLPLLKGQNNTFTIHELVSATGKAKSAVGSLLQRMISLGQVERVAAGQYQMTEHGRAVIGGQQASTNGSGAPTPQGRVINTVFIARVLRDVKTMTGKELRKQFVSDGRNLVAFDGAMGKLREWKFITTHERGVYSLTAKGRKHAQAS